MSESAPRLDQLRDDLAADLEVARAMSLGDWLRALVNLCLSAGLVCRTAIYSCVYAGNYGEKGAEISTSLWERPLTAEAWTPWDRLQASSVSLGVAIWLAGDLVTNQNEALVTAVVAVQVSVLAIDPVLALREVVAA